MPVRTDSFVPFNALRYSVSASNNLLRAPFYDNRTSTIMPYHRLEWFPEIESDHRNETPKFNFTHVGDFSVNKAVAELILDHYHQNPFHEETSRFSREYKTLYSVDQRNEFLVNWAVKELHFLNAFTRFKAHCEEVYGRVIGEIPFYDSDQNVLTGREAIKERAKWYNNQLCNLWTHSQRKTVFQSYLTDESNHALSSELSIAKAQLIDQLDAVIRQRILYLFDGNSIPMNSNQESVMRSMNIVREKCRFLFKTATTLSKCQTEFNTRKNQINSMQVQFSPVIMSQNLATIYTSEGHTLDLNYTISSTPFIYVLIAGEQTANMNKWFVTFDELDNPKLKLREIRPDGDEETFQTTMALEFRETPTVGTYETTIVTRNLNGPRSFKIKITVTEPAKDD